jgi:hypothetical protein
MEIVLDNVLGLKGIERQAVRIDSKQDSEADISDDDY